MNDIPKKFDEESKEEDRRCFLMTSANRYYFYEYKFRQEALESDKVCIVFDEVPGTNDQEEIKQAVDSTSKSIVYNLAEVQVASYDQKD